MRFALASITLLSVLLLPACSPLTLKPADFSWPVEMMLKVDGKGMVQENRYSIAVNVKELLFAETQDSVNVSRHTLRMIRDTRGYYFITASKFKNVYVFEHGDGALKLVSKIKVSEQGLESPALNQRPPYIQLVNEKDPPILLDRDGIQQGGKK